jgi:hypothetical protein
MAFAYRSFLGSVCETMNTMLALRVSMLISLACTHDLDVALGQFLQEFRNAGLAGLERPDVEHHRPPEEKAGRTREPGIQIAKPVFDRLLRRQDHGVVRTAMKPDGGAGAGNGCHFCASTEL